MIVLLAKYLGHAWNRCYLLLFALASMDSLMDFSVHWLRWLLGDKPATVPGFCTRSDTIGNFTMQEELLLARTGRTDKALWLYGIVLS